MRQLGPAHRLPLLLGDAAAWRSGSPSADGTSFASPIISRELRPARRACLVLPRSGVCPGRDRCSLPDARAVARLLASYVMAHTVRFIMDQLGRQLSEGGGLHDQLRVVPRNGLHGTWVRYLSGDERGLSALRSPF